MWTETIQITGDQQITIINNRGKSHVPGSGSSSFSLSRGNAGRSASGNLRNTLYMMRTDFLRRYGRVDVICTNNSQCSYSATSQTETCPDKERSRFLHPFSGALRSWWLLPWEWSRYVEHHHRRTYLLLVCDVWRESNLCQNNTARHSTVTLVLIVILRTLSSQHKKHCKSLSFHTVNVDKCQTDKKCHQTGRHINQVRACHLRRSIALVNQLPKHPPGDQILFLIAY